MEAANRGHAGGLGWLIAAGANLEAKDGDGWVASTLAASHGHGACLGLLIAAGADIEAKSKNGDNAAMCAGANGAEECLGLLMGANADLDAQDKGGWIAAKLAADKGDHGLAALIDGLILSRKEADALELELSGAAQGAGPCEFDAGARRLIWPVASRRLPSRLCDKLGWARKAGARPMLRAACGAAPRGGEQPGGSIWPSVCLGKAWIVLGRPFSWESVPVQGIAGLSTKKSC